MNKKVEITVEQMKGAVKANGKEPWTEVGIKRTTWFSILKQNGMTMAELRSSSSTVTPVATINPLPQLGTFAVRALKEGKGSAVDEVWAAKAYNQISDSIGRGGVRYRYTDSAKYEEWRKEDAMRIMEQNTKQEITHKPAERIVKPEIPEELLQYDQTDVPYEVWTKYIDTSKGEHWGTFVMKYGRYLEPKEHNSKSCVEARINEKLGAEYFTRHFGSGGKYNPNHDSYVLNGEEILF